MPGGWDCPTVYKTARDIKKAVNAIHTLEKLQSDGPGLKANKLQALWGNLNKTEQSAVSFSGEVKEHTNSLQYQVTLSDTMLRYKKSDRQI